jgi:hypothetical protein
MFMVANWTFLTCRSRVLLCIAHDPGVRLRDIAGSVGKAPAVQTAGSGIG